MTSIEKWLAEGAELEAKATKGWHRRNGDAGATIWGYVPHDASRTGSMRVAAFGHAGFDAANADFAADSRTRIPKMRRVIRAMTEELRFLHRHAGAHRKTDDPCRCDAHPLASIEKRFAAGEFDAEV